MANIDGLRVAERARHGAALGSIVAGLCVAIGAIRALVALFSGRGLADFRWADAGVLGAYVGGFIVAGAILGVLAPMRRTKAGALLMGLIGAATVCAAFGAAMAVSSAEYRDVTTVFAFIVSTLIFGVILAREFYEPGPPAA